MLALYFCLYLIMKFLTNDLPNVSSLITEIVRVPFIISTSTALPFRSK